MTACLIFLDIDGVLVNRRSLKERSGSRAVADAGCVAALNHITKQTGADIVLGPRLIRTEFEQGLTMANADGAIKLLGGAL